MIVDRRSFILAETTIARPPCVPEVALHLATEAVPLWQRTEAELGQIGLPPPFWAFAWAGGQALARYLLDHHEAVRGKTCLDFATGSGLVGIAAMLSGAATVTASDIDAFAVDATRLNAGLNGVEIETVLRDVIGEPVQQQIILMGDICYDREITRRLVPWLEDLADRGRTMLIGDPGRAYLPQERLTHLASYDIPVSRELEDRDVKQSSVWRFEPA